MNSVGAARLSSHAALCSYEDWEKPDGLESVGVFRFYTSLEAVSSGWETWPMHVVRQSFLVTRADFGIPPG